MAIYDIKNYALDERARKKIEDISSKLSDFATVRRSDVSEIKLKHEHAGDKTFYFTENGKCEIYLIIGDDTFSRIRQRRTGRPDR